MGNYTDYFPAASGGGACCPMIHFQATCSGWTPCIDGCVVIHVIGAGSKGCNCFAGGAGGYVRKTASFSTSDSPYCAFVGPSACNASESLFCGNGICLLACGAQTVTGGTASGGDINVAGGNGGGYFGGGGSVGIFGTSYTGGSGRTCGIRLGGGGAGVGGAGGPAGGITCINYGGRPGAGGGSGGAANQDTTLASCSDIGSNQPGPALIFPTVANQALFRFIPYFGAGGCFSASGGSAACQGGGYSSVPPGPGGGGSGAVGRSFGSQERQAVRAQNGGAFAGGGGGSGEQSYGGNGGYPGGGAGGSYCGFNDMCQIGGNGAIFIEYICV